MDHLLPSSSPSYGSLPNQPARMDQNQDQRNLSATCTTTISFHKINYTVKTRKDHKKVEKVVLNEVSGIFEPGMNVILGPTGSGKTSLLDILAARKDPKGLTGTVLVNGRALPDNFKLISGYVVQDDVVMGSLTVRENLEFSANLRLSKDVSKEERKSRVQDVIDELGLNLCAETKVGTPFMRGVSGGERKRTNVGMELIIKPSVLFLDEPTTGLDASTAHSVLALLSWYAIYKLFDRLHLLSLGNTVYHGPAQDALQYFSDHGYECEEHNNPADFFLDLINGDASAGTVAKGGSSTTLIAEDGRANAVCFEVEPDPESDKLPKTFKASECNDKLLEATNKIYEGYIKTDGTGVTFVGYPTSFLTQLFYVSKRTVLNVLRNPFATYMQIIFMILFALIVGGLYFQLNLSDPAGVQNRTGAIFFLVMNMVFSNMNAAELFIVERAIFIHESASGFYRVSSFFFAKVFCDLIPMRIAPTLVFASISYWMMGFKAQAGAFFIFCLTLLLTTITACIMSFAVSCTVSSATVASLIVSAFYIFMMIFGGVLLNIPNLPDWLSWLQYLSVFRFGINALSVNELVGLEFCTLINGTETDCRPGKYFLESQGIDATEWGLWQNEVALAAMSVILLVLGYIQLRRIPKLK